MLSYAKRAHLSARILDDPPRWTEAVESFTSSLAQEARSAGLGPELALRVWHEEAWSVPMHLDGNPGPVMVPVGYAMALALGIDVISVRPDAIVLNGEALTPRALLRPLAPAPEGLTVDWTPETETGPA